MTRTRGTKHRARRTAAQWQELVERFERTGQTRGQILPGTRIGAQHIRPVAAQAARDTGGR